MWITPPAENDPADKPMKATVSITFRPGVLDPEAQAIRGSLANLGFDQVSNVRRIRQIELDLDAADKSSAELAAREMCEKLLANPVIETYRIDIEG